MAEDYYVKAPQFVRVLFRQFDESSPSIQIERLLFFFFSSFMMAGAFIWGVICLSHGLRLPSLLPFGYVVVTLFNFLFLGESEKRATVVLNIQIFISITLPFLFQYSLGGVAASGFVMLWSILALLGSLILQESKFTYFWVAYFSMCVFLSFYWESTHGEEAIFHIPVFMTCVNVIMVSLMIYAFGSYFTNVQQRLRVRLHEKKSEVKNTNERIKSELETARRFQEVLFKYQRLEDGRQYNNIQVMQSRNGITGNFYWQGNTGENNVCVFIDNPCSGLRGSLEALFLRNLIENGVYRLRIKSARDLIDFVRKEIQYRYDAPEILIGMQDIGVAVVYHNELTQELDYAVLDTTLVIGNVLDGQTFGQLKTAIAPDDKEVDAGTIDIEQGMRILMMNRSFLNWKGIGNKKEILGGKNDVSHYLSRDMDRMEKKLKIEMSKAGDELDLFFKCIEI